MSIQSSKAIRPRTVSRKGKGGWSSAGKKEEKDSGSSTGRLNVRKSGSGWVRKNIVRNKPVKAKIQTTVVIHDKKKGGISMMNMYVKTRGIVQQAMDLLESWKYQPASICSSKLPVDIVALSDDMDMLVLVISSKHPIPDAKKINAIRLMGTAARFRKTN